jgi:uncharacterized membrane protein
VAVSKRLDRVFRISVTLKAIDGALEIIGGLLLLALSPSKINSLARTLTQHELSQDPHDFVARHVLQATRGLTHGTATYAGIYLLSHGLAKVVVIVAVLRDQLWAYPAMIALLGAFIAYQLYRIALAPTAGLTLLTVFDAFIVWLTWREYQSKRPGRRPVTGSNGRHRDHRRDIAGP